MKRLHHSQRMLGAVSALALTAAMLGSARAEDSQLLGYVYTDPNTQAQYQTELQDDRYQSALEPNIAPMPMAQPTPLPHDTMASAETPVYATSPYSGYEAEYSGSTTIRRNERGFVSFVTGGIGDDEKEALEQASKDYNLRILSAKKDGSFTGDTALMIENVKTGEAVDVTAGPIFLGELPPGKYRIQARNDGLTKEQTVNITAKKQSRVHLSW